MSLLVGGVSRWIHTEIDSMEKKVESAERNQKDKGRYSEWIEGWDYQNEVALPHAHKASSPKSRRGYTLSRPDLTPQFPLDLFKPNDIDIATVVNCLYRSFPTLHIYIKINGIQTQRVTPFM
jgi:hypothetical protein